MTKDELMAEGLLSVKEACLFLNVSRSKLWQFMSSGALPYTRLEGMRRIPKRALVEYAAKGLVERVPGLYDD